jgi:hypothetical protein
LQQRGDARLGAGQMGEFVQHNGHALRLRDLAGVAKGLFPSRASTSSNSAISSGDDTITTSPLSHSSSIR